MIPLLFAEIINRLLAYGLKTNSSLLLTISEGLLFLWKYVSIIFWYWVGKQFGVLKTGKVKNFIFGNALWGVSIVLFIWQFIFVSDVNRNPFIAGLSQSYMLSFVYISSRILSLFTNSLDSITIGIVAYIIMLVVFIVGFISSVYKTNNKK